MIDHQLIDSLPSRSGIYKFQNVDGKVIYVGKAKNIKRRVLGHFRSNSEKELVLCNKTHSVDFELTGNELIALLLEADLIQKHLPIFNTVQMKLRTAYHIISHQTKRGILQFTVEERPSMHEPSEHFFTVLAAKIRLEKLCDSFNLCPNFAGLRKKKGKCNHPKFPFCAGVCCGDETIDEYNQRAEQAFATLKSNSESYIIREKGTRYWQESLVLVLDGVYQGFGYVDGSQQVVGIDDILDLIAPRKYTYHTAQILNAYRKKNPSRIHPLH